ncbi:MAG: tetratricopeptide repeat protein [Gammaproteobacteria bacterium]|nr:tetratricopeptide repeat protein [Gammaproteobacteria bacterium]MDE0442508.1 tetratricopeptide repeat protein [Gammaproteobacteria bacterium]
MDEPIVAGVDISDTDVAEHLEALLQSVRTVPTSGSIRGRLGMAYDINGFREAAIATYDQASRLDPGDFRWPYFHAHLVAEDGGYEKALELLDRALATDAGYAPAWLSRGSWLLKSNRPQDAIDAYRRANELQASAYAAFGRAQSLMAVGEFADALEILESLATGFDHPYVHRTHGEALRALGRIDEARAAMARGREAEPLTWPDERRDQRTVHMRGHASYMLAKELSALGRVDEALAILRRLQGHHPEEHCGREEEFFLACNLMNSLSIAHDRAGRPAESLATAERGLALRPTFAGFHLTIAKVLRDTRDLETALNHVERAIDLSPSDGYAHEQRGRLLFGLNRYEDAKAAFESALQFEPGKRTTLFYLGLAQVELLAYDDAVESFRRVADIEPHFALGHVFLARSLAEVGRIGEARRAQDRAREYGANPAELRRNEIRLRELEANEPLEPPG